VWDIREWLIELGLDQHTDTFIDNAVDYSVLQHLNNEDLKDLGVSRLGDRKKILMAIAGLDSNSHAASAAGVHSDGGQRRWLTVLFCDLVNSTGLSSRQDPEDFRDIILSFQKLVANRIAEYHGHLAKFMGDGVIAYFGYPSASENDAENALRAAIAIQQAMKEERGPDGAQLLTRIGIATGAVIVGDLIGFGEARERTVIGDAPNLAARLQNLADPGTIVISRDTQELIDSRFKLSGMGKHQIKGLDKSIEIFRVDEAISHAPDSLTRTRKSTGLLIGRDQEVARILSLWDRVLDGNGQGLLLQADAGFGKSFLIRSLLEQLKDQCFYVVNQCSPYYTNEAFYPVIQRGALEAGIEQSDDLTTRLEKLEKFYRVSSKDASFLAWMYGLDATERYGEMSATPQEARAGVMRILMDAIGEGSLNIPIILIFEDVHWSDPSTLELIRMSLSDYADKRVFIIATTRPDYDERLSALSSMTMINLSRLGNDEIGKIIEDQAGAETLSQVNLQSIRDRCDGVPLFAKELTSTALQTRSETEEYASNRHDDDDIASVPRALRASLMARLDALSPHNEVAQIAACIGRSFDLPLLSRIMDRSLKELDQNLEILVESEIISPAKKEDGGDFVFTHALVRDVAYGSLLLRRRRSIHADILAQMNVTTMKEDTDLAASIHHASRAELWDQAHELTVWAASVELSKSAFNEAYAYIMLAKQHLARQPESIEEKRRNLQLDLMTRAALFPLGRHEDWGKHVNDAARRAEELDDGLSFSHAHGYLITYHYIKRDHQEAIRHGELGLEASHQSGDLSGQVNNSFNLALPKVAIGNFPACLNLLNDVVELTTDDPLEQHGLAGHPAVMALSCSANVYAQLGMKDQALERAARTKSLIGAEVASFTRIIGMTGIATAEAMYGSPDKAISLLEKAFEESEQMSVWMLYSMSGTMLADALLQINEPEKALQVIEKSINPQLLPAMPMGFCYPFATQARALIEIQDWDSSDQVITSAIAKAEEIGELPYVGELTFARALWEIKRGGGDREATNVALEASHTIAKELSMEYLLSKISKLTAVIT